MNKIICRACLISLLSFFTHQFLVAQENAGTNPLSITAMTSVPTADTWDDLFLSNTLRVDYMIAGNSENETVFLDEIKMEPNYGGPMKNRIDPFNYGTYRYAAYDSASGMLIFSRGFSNLFQEWQKTPEAKRVKRSFEQCAILPFPKNTIRFTIEKRRYEDGIFQKLFEIWIDPDDYFISRRSIHEYPFVKFHDSGDPSKKADIAFIAEGYTSEEMNKFLGDARRIGDYLLSQEPFKTYSDRMNFYAVESPSEESGVTVPGQNIYVNTNLNSSFYTFDMDRYMTTFQTKKVYDIAASVPYDAIFILVNSKIYGGGGFYNHYGESTVDHSLSNVVSMHEFGHSFAGLADEYYTAEITYSDFYNLSVEPWEPNITTNVDFRSKWQTRIDPGTLVPTPREKKYRKDIGLFEGGGYVSKGIYSPMMDCRMNTNEAAGYCPVCREAVSLMIRFYCEE